MLPTDPGQDQSCLSGEIGVNDACEFRHGPIFLRLIEQWKCRKCEPIPSQGNPPFVTAGGIRLIEISNDLRPDPLSRCHQRVEHQPQKGVSRVHCQRRAHSILSSSHFMIYLSRRTARHCALSDAKAHERLCTDESGLRHWPLRFALQPRCYLGKYAGLEPAVSHHSFSHFARRRGGAEDWENRHRPAQTGRAEHREQKPYATPHTRTGRSTSDSNSGRGRIRTAPTVWCPPC